MLLPASHPGWYRNQNCVSADVLEVLVSSVARQGRVTFNVYTLRSCASCYFDPMTSLRLFTDLQVTAPATGLQEIAQQHPVTEDEGVYASGGVALPVGQTPRSSEDTYLFLAVAATYYLCAPDPEVFAKTWADASDEPFGGTPTYERGEASWKALTSLLGDSAAKDLIGDGGDWLAPDDLEKAPEISWR